MLFIATEWEELKVLRLKTIANLMKNPAVFDRRKAKGSMVIIFPLAG
jgi:UDP-glucose 6-dehydrogenase